ncbi:MAG: hypothetical protein ACKO7W_19470 [Elainella sp.]
MSISASMLRLAWAVVEEAPPSDLLNLSDTMLIKLLLHQIAQKVLLTGEEVCALYDYLSSRVLLIRDMAEVRLHPEVWSLGQDYAVRQVG